jgi:hypothetical protein
LWCAKRESGLCCIGYQGNMNQLLNATLFWIANLGQTYLVVHQRRASKWTSYADAL